MAIKKKRLFSTASRALVSIVLLLLILLVVGLDRIVSVLAEFKPESILSLVGLMALIILLNALAVYVLVLGSKKIKVKKFFPNYLYSWTLGYLFPGRLGDFSLGFFLRKEMPIGTTSAIVLMDKLVSLAFFFFIGILLLAKLNMMDSIQSLVIAGILCVLLLAALLSKPGRNWLKKTLFAKNKELFTGFSKTLKSYLTKKKKFLAANFLVTIARAGVKAMLTVAMIQSLGFNFSLIDALLVNSTVMIVSIVPITISGLGIKESSFIFFASRLGLSEAAAAGSMVLANILNYGTVLLVFFIAVNKKIPEITEALSGKNKKVRRSKEKESLLLACGAITEKGEFLPTLLETEKKHKGKTIGVAGISVRYGFLPALFLAVNPKHRRKGIGAMLVKEVIKRKKGILFLTVAKNNKPALKIYKKAGFKKLSPWRKIRGKPHVLMFKW